MQIHSIAYVHDCSDLLDNSNDGGINISLKTNNQQFFKIFFTYKRYLFLILIHFLYLVSSNILLTYFYTENFIR